MKLIIENLGAIKQAQIDLSKKFILFCGKNSTGKTYASYVLHAFLADGGLFPLGCFKTILAEIKQNGSFSIKKEYVEEWLIANCDMVKEQMGSVFGISDQTCNKLFQKFNLSVEYNEQDFQNSILTPINASIKHGSGLCKITKQEGSNIVKIESDFDSNPLFEISNLRTLNFLCVIMRNLAFYNMANVRMLTVERNSIYTFKTELSISRNELIDHIQQSDSSEFDIFEMLNRSSRRYPQAVRSSLRIANDLENVQKTESKFSVVADMIERNLLKGEVNMTKNGDVEFHAENMPKTRRLPFHLSASIVKTMASLVIYLRHIANVGDTLIIDEPEMNFHPDVQVLLARIFAILTARGLRVVVSTHSDYIVRELNSLIMAKAISDNGEKGLVQELGFSDEMLLNKEDLAVMLFERASKNIVSVNSLPINSDGFEITSIDDTIMEQNRIAETLYAALIDNE